MEIIILNNLGKNEDFAKSSALDKSILTLKPRFGVDFK